MIRLRNRLPTLVATFLLYGGLNQMVFLFLFFLFFCVGVLVYVMFSLWPLVFSAFWYSGAAWLKMCSSDDMSEILRPMADDMFLMMLGGWLDCVCMYMGLSLGFL